ncbi:MAG TPA: hypothetical protein EYP74_04510 [Anaerolineales bacterium]|nr:hypothetical protein [Anaerolineales bacterium]
MIRKIKNFFFKAPFFVTILGVMALILVVLNATRFGTALVQWNLILDFMPKPGPAYIAATGLLWASCWLIIYLSIQLAWRRGGVAFLLLSFLYASYYWIDRFFLQPHAERSNALFAFIATLLFLIGSMIILALPESRAYFAGKGEVNESKAEITNPKELLN